MNKIIKDGKVAVLVSEGFGAGWSTWNYGDYPAEELVFCPELVTAILAGASPEEVKTLAKSLFPEAYDGGADDLVVKWVPVGTTFRIAEYDGKESLELLDRVDWLRA